MNIDYQIFLLFEKQENEYDWFGLDSKESEITSIWLMIFQEKQDTIRKVIVSEEHKKKQHWGERRNIGGNAWNHSQENVKINK